MKFNRLKIISALVALVIIGVGIKFFASSSKTESFFLEGNYALQEKTIDIPGGMVIVTVPQDEMFFVRSEKAGEGLVTPWSDIIYLTIRLADGRIVKMTGGREGKLLVPFRQKIVLGVRYNPQYFNPLSDKVWTGVEDPEVVMFDFGKINVKIRVARQYRKAIPDFIPLSSQRKKKEEGGPEYFHPHLPVIISQGVTVANRALGLAPEAKEDREFWTTKLSKNKNLRRLLGAIFLKGGKK